MPKIKRIEKILTNTVFNDIITVYMYFIRRKFQMKRKLLSFVVAFALLSQTLVFAGTLTTGILSQNSGAPQTYPAITADTGVYVSPAGTNAYSTTTTAQDFDLKASIDMTTVRTYFDYYYTAGSASAASYGGTALTDFENSNVTGDFTIKFTYTDGVSQPAGATKPFSQATLDAQLVSKGSIFTVTDATYGSGIATVTAKVRSGITAKSLYDNKNTYLVNFDLDLDKLNATTKKSEITVYMTGYVDITEADETKPFARFDFHSDSLTTAYVYNVSSGSSGGGDSTKAPDVTLVGLPTDVNVIKTGSNYHVESSDLPAEDEEGNKIYGWYTDEDMTEPVLVDENGKIKITKDTSFYYRTVPIANAVVDGDIDPVDVSSNNDGTFTVDMTTLPSQDNEGHKIYGWDLDEEHKNPAKPNANDILKIDSDTYLYPRTKPIAATVTGGLISYVSVLQSDDNTFTINIDEIEKPEKEGFAFIAWYTEPNFINPVNGITTVNKDTYLYPQYRNIVPPEEMISEEHILYVYGYPDGEVKPNGYITREEVAAIFCRLLKPEYRASIETDENSFPDVESGRWSNREISTMANGGYIVGDENGYFNPAKPITRAEFTVIASKFAGIDAISAENNFTDIEGHWAKDFILKAAGQYWITGYEDLTFRPQNKITRAEAMTIVNTMLVRYGDINSEYAKQWPDVKKTDWYYSQVIEATSHNYFTRNEDGWSETWIYADEDNNSHAR